MVLLLRSVLILILLFCISCSTTLVKPDSGQSQVKALFGKKTLETLSESVNEMRKSYKMGTFSEARFYEALFAKLQSLGVWPNNLSFEEQGGRRLFRRTIEFGTAKNVFLSLWDGSRFIKYNYAGLPNRTIKLQSVTLDQGVSSKARSLKTISVYELQQPSTLAKLKNYYQGHCEALGSENNLLAIQQQKNKIQDALKPKNPHQRAVASATMPKPQALHKKDKSLFITWGTEKYEKRFFVEDKKKVRVLGRTTCQ